MQRQVHQEKTKQMKSDQMETLNYHPYPKMTSDNDPDMDSLLLSSCWNQTPTSELSNEYMLTEKLEPPLDTIDPMTDTNDDKLLAICPDQGKTTIDVFDNLILNSNSMNLAELKPLPPFTGYTGHLNINGIQGHHYHAIAQQHRIVEENNNYSNYTEHNIVSSSTCVGDADPQRGKSMYTIDDVNEANLAIKLELDVADSCMDAVTNVKNELDISSNEYDISSFEDIASIIGSAMISETTVADTTSVPKKPLDECSRDSWMDLDAWIEGACSDNPKEMMNEQFALPQQQSDEYKDYKMQQQQSTLQSLLTHGYMPLLQNRLQNGPGSSTVQQNVKNEISSTSYGVDMISTSSPPSVVSTTDNLLNNRYLQHHSYLMDDQRMRSPDMDMVNYHPTTTTPTVLKKSKARSTKKHASSTMFASDQTLALLGKEKPVHRCNICNRGFLNKSNIKVHLRTHTGEKPFRCETCAKAFRQKAHLIKHQQIHKRIGRD